ncbi:MAG TPA: BatA domain-containing protein, partial [Conexibacter sp.]|nr:BatA domain-containing protein [Conexibacter sp.]
MSFATPLGLLALALVPLALALHGASRRRARRYAVRFPAAATLALAAGRAPAWRRHVPIALLLAAIAALALALA